MWSRWPHDIWRREAFHALSLGARVLHVSAWSYCGDQETDGRVSAIGLTMLCAAIGVDRCASAELVAAGFWSPDGDGFTLPEWSETNPPAAQVRATSSARADAGRRGGVRSGETRRQREIEAIAPAIAPAIASKHDTIRNDTIRNETISQRDDDTTGALADASSRDTPLDRVTAVLDLLGRDVLAASDRRRVTRVFEALPHRDCVAIAEDYMAWQCMQAEQYEALSGKRGQQKYQPHRDRIDGWTNMCFDERRGGKTQYRVGEQHEQRDLVKTGVAAFDALCESARATRGDGFVQTWLVPLTSYQRNGTLVLIAPDAYHHQWVTERYKSVLQQQLADAGYGDLQIDITLG